jgi:TolB-like protein
VGKLFILGPILASLFTVWTSFGTAPLYAQVKGLIVGPGAEQFPIAVSPLKNMGQVVDDKRLSEAIADVVARDMVLSGWFRVLDRSAYIEYPQRSGIKLGSFDFRDWSTIGAEALVKGGFEVKGEILVTEFRLFDVYQRKQIVGKRYTGKVKDFRRIAHKFAECGVSSTLGSHTFPPQEGALRKSMLLIWMGLKRSRSRKIVPSTCFLLGPLTDGRSSTHLIRAVSLTFTNLTFSLGRKQTFPLVRV